MNCLKCGRETTDDHVFCDSCRAEMEKYPVRPGTAVMLPRRQEVVVQKKPKRRAPPSAAVQVRRLKRQRFLLWLLVIVLVLGLSAAAAALYHLSNAPGTKPGQNYAVAETVTPAK